ncbi:MAG TPA: type II toxin-antitoxin system RelE/ParE family toxin [Bacilli bacterium]|nr:type II toxin-antitoxin system RelE/ParE family toxin [Bacilli bacterium]
MDDPFVAKETLNKLFKSFKILERFPSSGVKVIDDSLNRYQFRMIISEPYIAFYRIIGNTVYIYRILHGARDYIQILKKIIN